MAENPKQNLQSTDIIAKLFDLDVRRVQQLAKEGILPAASQRPYKFDLLPTVKAYIRYLRDRANGKEAKTADTVKAEADKLRAEADLKQSKAKIAELQLKELEGKMHRSEDVEGESRAGMTFLKVWGHTMYTMVCTKENPWDSAASNWPLGMEFKPPLKISAMTADVNRVMANTEMATLFPLMVK